MSGSRFLMLVLMGCGFVGAAESARGQILDTLRGFASDDVGWSGSAEVRFSVTGGNTDIFALTGGGRAQWQGEAHRWRLITAGTRVTSDGTDIAEATQLHLRHNACIAGRLHSLTFTQHQRNPFQRLRSRFLLGAGVRMDLVRRERFNLAIGGAHMVEVEQIEDESGSDTDHRLSSFVMATGELNERVTLDVTGFAQPLWKSIADRRAILNAAIRVTLGSGFYLNLTQTLAHDTTPPDDIEKTDWKVQSGLGVAF